MEFGNLSIRGVATLIALRQCAGNEIIFGMFGQQFVPTYLENARRLMKPELDEIGFELQLDELEAHGLYLPQGGNVGMVKIQ